MRLAAALRYAGLGTFEFLVDRIGTAQRRSSFIEANPRLQVEHTVTEEVTGIDLVQAQLELARGRSLAELGLSRSSAEPRGFAIQLRVNMETMDADGAIRPDRRDAVAASSRRPARACASIRLATPAIRPTPASIRCWPR